MVSAILRLWTHVSLRLASYRDGARVATRVFETGQKASDQTFANGFADVREACCEGVPLYLHTVSTGFSLDKETSTSIRGKGWCSVTFLEKPNPTSLLYRQMAWCFFYMIAAILTAFMLFTTFLFAKR